MQNSHGVVMPFFTYQCPKRCVWQSVFVTLQSYTLINKVAFRKENNAPSSNQHAIDYTSEFMFTQSSKSCSLELRLPDFDVWIRV